MNISNPLTPKSLTSAVKKKAENAHRHVLRAKAQLDAANRELEQALPEEDMRTIKRAAERTLAAEEGMEQASSELEAVDILLEDDLHRRGATQGKPGARSGQGASSVVPHLKKHV